jgi:hypothetical protein
MHRHCSLLSPTLLVRVTAGGAAAPVARHALLGGGATHRAPTPVKGIGHHTALSGRVVGSLGEQSVEVAPTDTMRLPR